MLMMAHSLCVSASDGHGHVTRIVLPYLTSTKHDLPSSSRQIQKKLQIAKQGSRKVSRLSLVLSLLENMEHLALKSG